MSNNESTTQTTHDCATGEVDEEHLIDTTVDEEPVIAVEISMDADPLESHKDRDISESVVMFKDKGKYVDPREYGGAMCNPTSMMVSTSTNSPGVSELVDVHLNKGKDDGPRRRWNRVAEYESGPSRIDFPNYYDSESNVVHTVHMQMLPLRSSNPEEIIDFTSRGPPCEPTHPRLRWHPKVSPYRLIVFSIPAGIGTAKAILSQKGNVTAPITLEWISGVVVFLV